MTNKPWCPTLNGNGNCNKQCTTICALAPLGDTTPPKGVDLTPCPTPATADDTEVHYGPVSIDNNGAWACARCGRNGGPV